MPIVIKSTSYMKCQLTLDKGCAVGYINRKNKDGNFESSVL
jgi:hypothetical protein